MDPEAGMSSGAPIQASSAFFFFFSYEKHDSGRQVKAGTVQIR